jgi:hypothetical protein
MGMVVPRAHYLRARVCVCVDLDPVETTYARKRRKGRHAAKRKKTQRENETMKRCTHIYTKQKRCEYPQWAGKKEQ